MYKAIILPLAKQDITEAALWYNKKQKGLGKRFTAHVRETVYYIKQNPEAFNVRYDKVRTAILNVFPFMIHYTVDEKNKIVVIAAVLHTSRNPDIWKKK